MSRARLPRRIAAGIAFSTALWAAPAAAQIEGPGVVVRLGANTHARACADFAAELNASDAALMRCTRALREEARNPPNLIVTYINRGNIYLARGEYAAALGDFDTVLVMNPENGEAHMNRGVALIALERFGPAIAALTEAVSRGVHEPYKAYYNRAVAREALSDFRGALEDYTTALEIRPDWGMADAEMQRLARLRQERLAQSAEVAAP